MVIGFFTALREREGKTFPNFTHAPIGNLRIIKCIITFRFVFGEVESVMSRRKYLAFYTVAHKYIGFLSKM